MKVVLFCGGQGLRIREHTETIPKPMVTVGYRPILWHVMRYYAHFGMKDYVLCLGYRADAIKDYFLGYSEAISNDFVMADGGRSIELLRSDIHDWRISFIDTGLHASVGQRLRAVRSLLQEDDVFLASYGDCLTSAPLPDLIRRFRRSGKLAAFLAVRPRSYTFHLVRFEGRHQVRDVQDVSTADLWLNGGYFMFRREVLDELGPDDDLVPDLLPRLIERDQVLGYRYDGFWAPMDTLRDWQKLEEFVQSGDMPWAVWQKPAAGAPAGPPDVTVVGVDGGRVIGVSVGANEPLAILALGAHPDDIEIGAGGLILELLDAGRVGQLTWVVVAADGPRGEEARASAETLVGDRASLAVELWTFGERYFPHDPAIREAFDDLRLRVRPDFVIGPRLEDRHQDHRVVAELAWQTFRGSMIVEYEIPKYEGDLGSPNLFVALSTATVDRKVDHLMAAFPSQRDRSWFTRETFRGLARIRGIEAAAQSGYAEGFTCRKAVVVL